MLDTEGMNHQNSLYDHAHEVDASKVASLLFCTCFLPAPSPATAWCTMCPLWGRVPGAVSDASSRLCRGLLLPVSYCSWLLFVHYWHLLRNVHQSTGHSKTLEESIRGDTCHDELTLKKIISFYTSMVNNKRRYSQWSFHLTFPSPSGWCQLHALAEFICARLTTHFSLLHSPSQKQCALPQGRSKGMRMQPHSECAPHPLSLAQHKLLKF